MKHLSLVQDFAAKARKSIEKREEEIEDNFDELIATDYQQIAAQFKTLSSQLNFPKNRNAYRNFLGKTIEECVGLIGYELEPERYKITTPKTRDHALALAFSKFVACIEFGIGTANADVFYLFLLDPSLGFSIIRIGNYLKKLKIPTRPFKDILIAFRDKNPAFSNDVKALTAFSRIGMRRDSPRLFERVDVAVVKKKVLRARTALFRHILLHF
jgi:hypothetical protein